MANGFGYASSAPAQAALSEQTPTATVAEETSSRAEFSDGELVNTYYQMDSAIRNQPTVVLDGVDEKTIAAAVQATEKPSNIILRFDGDGNIVAANGDVIGSFENVWRTYLRNKCIPVLRIEDEGAADKFIALTEEFALLDMSVMSGDAALLKKIRTAATWVRGILRLENATDVAQAVATANKSYAATVMIDQKDATLETVNYI